MRFAYRERCLDHDTGPRHPETPDRLRAIRRGLSREYGVEYASPDDVSVDLVKRVHDADYIESVRAFCADGGGMWDGDTVAVEATWDAALASAGSAVWAATEAISGSSGRDTPFSLGRPPGHHAEYDDAMGFCFINNSAVAAQAALDTGVDRVAIFDWDVHHGNGIQDIFEERGDVLYISTHERGLYPGTGEVEEVGTGDGEGANVNLPLPPGSDDAVYVASFDEVIAPVLDRFDPGLFIVSAGFDAHERDPISRMRVSTEGYAMLAWRIRELAAQRDLPVAFVLEGGYGLESLSESIRTVNDTFEGREPVAPNAPVKENAREVIDAVRNAHDLA